MSAESEELAIRESEMRIVQPSQSVSIPSAQLVEQHLPQQNACPHLSQALSNARDKCKMATKGSRNEFHKYNYASADEVILTAKEALESSGLAIIPQLQEMTVLGSGNAVMYALNRIIFLSHSSGEFVPIELRGWPVVPERGKPLDKAFATALTGSFAYMLRDLLQMPRGDDADMNHRNDAPPPAKPAAKPQTQPAKQQSIPSEADEAAIVREHAKALEDADTLQELSGAWDAVRSDKRIGIEDKTKLAKVKDERKAAMMATEGAAA